MIELLKIKHGILNIESCAIPKGYICIIGENGSGKSSLLKLLSGLEMPDTGSILSDGNYIRNLNVGYVPEYPERQIIFDTVFDEIISPLRFSFTNPDIAEKKIVNLTNKLEISNLLKNKTRNLSGGEKAFVALAVALATDPEILALDEPDSHLDFEASEKLFKFLKKSETDYILHSTQDMNLAEKADFLIFMHKGKIKYSGIPDSVFEILQDTPFVPLSWRLKNIV
ncbi:MAG: ATP-binding cassette domain-containing protein [Methanomicrobiaceae archaeon]|nr:ATP-binding cassette domain-containing protein [Methanomicrobiaceae archaeon]